MRTDDIHFDRSSGIHKSLSDLKLERAFKGQSSWIHIKVYDKTEDDSNRFRQMHEHIETRLTSDGHSVDDHSRELLQFEATVMHSYRPKQLLLQHKTHHQTDGSGAHESTE